MINNFILCCLESNTLFLCGLEGNNFILCGLPGGYPSPGKPHKIKLLPSKPHKIKLININYYII